MDAERLLIEHLDHIDRIVAGIWRRNRMRVDDMEDFASTVRLKLVANDYQVLRAWAGRSSLPVYLVAVINRAFLDYRNSLWGKWRPSAEARRLGPLAVCLDTLLHRDRLSLEEATARLAPEEREEAARLAARLPPRVRRRIESDANLEELPTSDPTPEQTLLTAEREEIRTKVQAAMREALATLEAEDRMLVKLRLEDGFTMVEAARALHCEAKPLYRRYERILHNLRSRLGERGWTAESVVPVLEPAPAPHQPSFSSSAAEPRS